MHDVQDYQVVGKLKDYGRMIHCQSEVRMSKFYTVYMYMYVRVCVCACVCVCVCACVCIYVYMCVFMFCAYCMHQYNFT